MRAAGLHLNCCAAPIITVLLAAGVAAAAQQCPETCQLRTSCESYTPFPVKLRWLKSAQFAGFYAAKALGFWEDECLGVSLRPATFDYDPTRLWLQQPDTRAVIPWYLDHLVQATTLGKDVHHVSQYFSRSALRWWTSPVVAPERTLSLRSYADVDTLVQCTPGNLRLSHNIYALMSKHNRTGCNYIDPFTEQLVPCKGTENVRFVLCGFDVQEVLDISKSHVSAHITDGMVYDQMGQMLSTVIDGRLFKEGIDFKVFDFADDGIHNIEDGISVNRTWLAEHGSEETLVRFLKGLHRGWIYCRDNADACAELVSPSGQDPALQMHQRYQMHEVNKLIWPAPGGIGLHLQDKMESVLEPAVQYGLVNRSVPLSEHTTDKYVRLANQRLVEDGYDVEGAYFTQPAFQRRLVFCLDENKLPALCTASTATQEETNGGVVKALIASASVLLVMALFALAVWYWMRKRKLPSHLKALMRRNPPGLGTNGRPVTIVVTDIESSTELWATFPEDMAEAQALHDKCLRQCIQECHGYEVHTEGDSFTVAFHEAEEALHWCVRVQTTLQAQPWPSKLTAAAGPNCKPNSGPSTPTTPGTSKHSGGLWKTISGLRRPSSRDDLSQLPSGGQLVADANMQAELQELYSQLDTSKPHQTRNLSWGQRLSKFVAGFNGLRVRMGCHTAHVTTIRRHAITNRVIYDEALVKQAKLVSETGCGGQVILTSSTMAEVSADASIAEHACIVHMGCHVLVAAAKLAAELESSEICIHPDLPAGESMDGSSGRCGPIAGVELFMLLPYQLMSRIFYCKDLSTETRLSCGYLQAPRKDSVTICFTAIHRLESLTCDLPEQSDTMVEMLCNCARSLLLKHDGYECEEHKGSFMLAFHTPMAAVSWAIDVQEALLGLPWPDKILLHPSCETWQMENNVTFNGPRLKVGIAAGEVIKKIPNPSTGRADYFGPLLNQAARILSKARGGQVLVDSVTWDMMTAHDSYTSSLVGVNLGNFGLKGVEKQVCLYQVSDERSRVALRSFPVIRKMAFGLPLATAPHSSLTSRYKSNPDRRTSPRPSAPSSRQSNDGKSHRRNGQKPPRRNQSATGIMRTSLKVMSKRALSSSVPNNARSQHSSTGALEPHGCPPLAEIAKWHSEH